MLGNLIRRPEARTGPGSMSWPDYQNLWEMFGFNGVQYMTPAGTLGQMTALQAIRNPIILACIIIRLCTFAEISFAFQNRIGGQGGRNLFGTPALGILEQPWPGGCTGDLLGRMEIDASMYGNSYWWKSAPNVLTWLDPTRMKILTGDVAGPSGGKVGATLLAYQLQDRQGQPEETFLPSEIVHYRPIPDPDHAFRGLSWLSALLPDITTDHDIVEFKHGFLKNSATPNLVVQFTNNIGQEAFNAFRDKMETSHVGPSQAFKTLYLGSGADVKTVGSNWSDMELFATQSYGEPLALDTPVPTPTGWTTMGEIEVGDFVFGRDGQPSRVVGTSPIHHDRECYEVSFSDGTSIVADASHLWTAMDVNRGDRAERTYTTVEMRDLMVEWAARGKASYGHRLRIPAGAPVELPEADLAIDPYLLGAWLGDGDSAGAAICGAHEDLSVITAEITARGYRIVPRKPYAGKVSVVGVLGGVKVALRDLGVLGNKHIPAVYLRASKQQRLDLLRGLMDTDGAAGGGPNQSTCEFSSKWEHLARQVAELARSLGCRAGVYRKVEPRSRTGETWRVVWRADPDLVPFLLPRKAALCQKPVKVRNRSVVSIERVASVPVRCIAVDAPDHLFRAGIGWTLTHNTRLCVAAGVPASMVGIAEGLKGSALNAGNYSATRRRFSDVTMRPLWRMSCAALTPAVAPLPAGARLWYDDRDVMFLQADMQDAANTRKADASTIMQLISSGFDPSSVRDAVVQGDFTKLEPIPKLTSVQLQPVPDPDAAPAGDPTDEPAASGDDGGTDDKAA